VIVCSLILACDLPIERFRRRRRFWKFLKHLAVNAFGVRPLFLLECDSRQGHSKLRFELVLRQVAFNAMSFRALQIKDQNRWCPADVEAVEPRGMLLYMSLNRQKFFMNEGGDARIRV